VRREGRSWQCTVWSWREEIVLREVILDRRAIIKMDLGMPVEWLQRAVDRPQWPCPVQVALNGSGAPVQFIIDHLVNYRL